MVLTQEETIMRATITATAHNRATLTETDPLTDERVITEYFAPDGGGYVRINDGRRYPQVCECLGSRGPTLRWSGLAPLVDMIRRERARAMRSELKAAAW
jgi:hypothetical protein